MDNPFVLRHGNIIVAKNAIKETEHKAFALFELFATHGEFNKQDTRQQRFYWVDACLSALMRSGQIFMTPFPPDPMGRLEADREYIPEDTPWDLQVYYEENLEQMYNHLKKNPKEYRIILVVNVKETSGNPWADLLYLTKEVVRDPVRRMEWRLGGRPFTLASSQWKRFKKDEAELYRILEGGLGARRLTYKEVDYMLERFASPGVEPPKREGNGEYMEIGPDGASILVANPAETVPVFEDVTLFSDKDFPGEIRFKKVFPEGVREGYFSTLVINRLPRGYSQYPEITGLFPILQQRFNFPVELSVEFVPLVWSYLKWGMEARKFIGEARNKNRRSQGKDVDEESLASEEDTVALKNLLERQGAPLFRSQISIRVWGETREQLYERRKEIVEILNAVKYEVLVPSRQLPLFFNMLPGNPRKTGHQYIIKNTSEWLAALGPMDGVVLGDQNGVYVGDVIPFDERLNDEIQGVPVLFDIRRGSRDRRFSFSPAIIHYGSPGSGKSTLANYLLVQDVLRGNKCLVFDPKNERWAWMFEIPALRHMINLVTLNEEDDKGKLDPLLRVQGGKADRVAIQMAKNILNYLAETKNKTYAQLAIGKAVDLIVEQFKQQDYHGRRASMHQVLEVLREFVDGKRDFDFPGGTEIRKIAVLQAAEALAKLDYHKDASLARLLFGEGHEDFIDVTKPITLLQVEGLIKSDKEEDPDTIVNTAVVMAICDLLEWFVAQKSGGRMVVFEELHEFGEKETIRRQVRQLLRKGRSMRNVVQLIIHNSRDMDLDRNLDEDGESEVRSSLGTRFVYRVADPGEARKALKVLDIEPTDELVKYMSTIGQMESGMFLMRDVEGNVGLVRFQLDKVDPILYEAFRTDEEATRRREKKFGNQAYQENLLEVEA